MPVIDTHCHLDMVAARGIPLNTALENAMAQGVEAIVQIAVDLDSSKQNYHEIVAYGRGDIHQNGSLGNGQNTDKHLPQIYWTAGIHPDSARDDSPLDELGNFIRERRDDKAFIGIGETGLDYFHSTEFEGAQKNSFRRHLELASELNLPVVLHMRDGQKYDPEDVRAASDALSMLKDHPGVCGVLHCFTYSMREAEPFVELGWKVSFSGILTYPNAAELREAALQLPLSCLMTETDAPFLAPRPERGKCNEPAFVAHTLDFLTTLRAEALGENPETIRATIYENSRHFLNWKNLIATS